MSLNITDYDRMLTIASDEAEASGHPSYMWAGWADTWIVDETPPTGRSRYLRITPEGHVSCHRSDGNEADPLRDWLRQ